MSRWVWPRARLIPFAVALAVALGACSGGGDDPVEAAVAPVQPAPAPPPQPLTEQLPEAGLEADGRMAPWAVAVQIGATMHALAEACGHHDAASLRQMQASQRAEMTAGGIDGARFDAVWDWARRHAGEKIKAQPANELAQGCARLIEMEEEAARMGEVMQQVTLPPS